MALEVARATDALADGVAFVDLAAVTEPNLLPATVAAALGLREAPAEQAMAGLVNHVRGSEMLLVLDSCEHLRQAVAALVERLLTAASDLRILATSREVLGLPGEATYAVPAMTLPSLDDDAESLMRSDAVRLLVDRATRSRHDLRIEAAGYRTAARICRELEGLPLAIELAAARSNVLSLDEIASRLEDRFGFLVSSRRSATPRHAALRAAMDWSYDLLDHDARDLLARLSVFPAGAGLRSIAEVCLAGDAREAERLLERLVDASLVLPVDGPSGTRYRLLETVREYAASRLAEPELEPLRRRHAEQTRDLAVAANLALEQVAAGMSFEPIWDELASIRAAIEWAVDADPPLGVEIACALERFWTTGHSREGIDAFDALLAHEALGEFARARALRCRGGARYSSGDFAGGTADYDSAIAIHRRLGQPAYVAHLQLRNGVEALRQRDFERARRSLDEAEATGGTERFAPDRIIELSIRADLAFEGSLIAEGFELLHEAVVYAEGSSDEWWLRSLHIELADRGLEFGRLDVVAASAREALRLAQRLHDRQATIWALSMLARAASRSGEHERAGRIWGGLEAEGERGGRTGRWALAEEPLREELAAVGGDAFLAGRAAGRSMSLAETVIEAALRLTSA